MMGREALYKMCICFLLCKVEIGFMTIKSRKTGLVCPRVREGYANGYPQKFGPRNRVKEGKRFQEGTYINAKKDLDKMQDVNQRYLK